MENAASIDEMLKVVFDATRVAHWSTIERMSFETALKHGAGLYVVSMIAVLENGDVLHDLSLGRLPADVDGDAFLKRLMGPASGPGIDVPPADDQRLFLALVEALGAHPTQVTSGGDRVGASHSFIHTREQEGAFQARPLPAASVVEEARAARSWWTPDVGTPGPGGARTTSTRHQGATKPWWRFW